MGIEISGLRVDLDMLDKNLKVQSDLFLMTGCKFYSGGYQDVKQLKTNFDNLRENNAFFFNKVEFNLLCRNTPLDGADDYAFDAFQTPQAKVSVLEFYSAVTIYSAMLWSRKVGLIYQLFDFDKNGIITLDELTIICISFLQSLSKLLNKQAPTHSQCKKIAKQIFKFCDKSHGNGLSLNELKQYARQTDNVYNTLNSNSPKIRSISGQRIQKQPSRITDQSKTPIINASKKLFSPIKIAAVPQKAQISLRNKTNGRIRRKPSNLDVQRNTSFQSYRQQHRILVQAKTVSPITRRAKKLPTIGNHTFMVIRNKKITKALITKMKQIYDNCPKNQYGKPNKRCLLKTFEDIQNILPEFSIQNLRKFMKYEHLSFIDVCKTIFQDASIDQVSRMLEWVNEEFSPTALRDNRRLSLATGRRYKEIFDRYDLNKDGLLSFEEFKSAYDDQLSQEIVQALFNKFDVDKNNLLDFKEFLKMVLEDTHFPREVMNEIMNK